MTLTKLSTLTSSLALAPLLALSLALSLSMGNAQAQGPDGPRGRQGPDLEKRVAHMAVELGLTDEQSEQLLAVLQASAAEHQELKQRMDEQFKPELCALQLATKEQIREILTTEQAAEMEDRLDRMAGAAESREGRGQPGGHRLDCEAEG